MAGSFLATAAQLLDVSGPMVFLLVIVGGAGAIVAHWRWKRSRWQSVSGGAVTVACFAGVLLLAGLAEPPAAGGAATPGGTIQVGPPDPNFFVAYNGQPISRKQQCVGLLGLCFGQPISYATQVFGATEASGYPSPGEPTTFGAPTLCHSWNLPKIQAVDVCEVGGAISSIRVFSMADTDMSLAAPEKLTVYFPQALGDNAELITEALRTKPFESQYLQDEGASVYTFAWFYPPAAEGIPDLKIRLVARVAGFPDEAPEACSAELSRYRYADVLPLTRKAPTISVEVSSTTSEDLAEPAGCS